eukprot:TRINITY_DN1470_c0_g1_i10.p1 TRINITY_DN1470_c0_g1~~TRINITY_DN1470_c0_g1_i10.p1  ORF type:complete len:229 (-),score=41.49 TRINITY_DN1470_c0_g1_i10:1895-2581(-)
MQKNIVQHPVLICDIKPYQCILGRDFMKRTQAVLDMGQSTVTLQEPGTSEVRRNLRLQKAVQVPSGHFVLASVRYSYPKGHCLAVVADERPSDLYPLKSVTNIDKSGSCVVMLINDKSHVVSLPAGAVVGVLECADMVVAEQLDSVGQPSISRVNIVVAGEEQAEQGPTVEMEPKEQVPPSIEQVIESIVSMCTELQEDESPFQVAPILHQLAVLTCVQSWASQAGKN